MRSLPLLLGLPLLVACIPPSGMPEPVLAPTPMPAPQQQVRTPPPTPQPAPAPLQQPVQPPTPSSTVLAAWADAPLSPGRWTYQPGRGGPSRAFFGPANAPSFVVACDAPRSISMTRTGAAPGGGITIRTSSTARTIPGAFGPQGLRAQLPANDPVLDAIAFSRGRFAVEAPGTSPLVIPAWPELARVVEDCRR